MEALDNEDRDLRPIDEIPSPQKGIVFRVVGFGIMLPLTWFLLSVIESPFGVIIGAVVVAIVAVWAAVALGSQKQSSR